MPPTTLRSEIAEGVRWLARNRLLRILAVAIALMNLTLSATLSISVLYAQERLGLGPVGYGVLFASMAVGGITASLVAERVIGWLGPATTLRVGLIIESSTHLVLVLVLVLARSPLLVGSIFALFGFGSLSLGAVAGGLLAARYGLTAPFWCSFAAMSVLTLACWPILSARAVAAAREQAAA
jgi:Na+/melibiose symporter-like transporter